MRHDTVEAPIFTRIDPATRDRHWVRAPNRCLVGVALALSCQAFAPNDPPIGSPPPLEGMVGPTRGPPASSSEFIGRAGSGGAGRAGSGGGAGSASDASDAGEDAAPDAAFEADAAGGGGAVLDSGAAADSAP